MEIHLRRYPVEFLTSSYRISGEMEPRGDPGTYLNDHSVSAFAILEATIEPLAVDASIGVIKQGVIYLPKTQVQVAVLGGYTAAEARPLPRKERLVVLTDTYAVRAYFHMGPEVKVADMFFVMGGPFFPATEAEIAALRPLTTEVGGTTELAFVHRDAVRAYYQA